jgi:hypothetical protein
MQNTLFEIKFYDGTTQNIICIGESQLKRFSSYVKENFDQIEYWEEVVRGVNTITDLEKRLTNKL